MIIGYARTSTLEQVAGFETQIKELEKAGCEKIYQEQVSSQGKRLELLSALDFVREGDTFVVTKLDRLARHMKNFMDILETLSKKKVALKVLNLGLDTQTPTGGLILNVLACIAQFEREMMLERQREGILKAKREGKYKGRKPLSDPIREEVLKLSESGLSKSLIGKQLGIGRASVYRILKS